MSWWFAWGWRRDVTGITTADVRVKGKTLINKIAGSGSNKGFEWQWSGSRRPPAGNSGGIKADNTAKQFPRSSIDFNLILRSDMFAPFWWEFLLVLLFILFFTPLSVWNRGCMDSPAIYGFQKGLHFKTRSSISTKSPADILSKSA